MCSFRSLILLGEKVGDFLEELWPSRFVFKQQIILPFKRHKAFLRQVLGFETLQQRKRRLTMQRERHHLKLGRKLEPLSV